MAAEVTQLEPNRAPGRAPKGLLVRPRQQFKYAFLLLAGGMIAQSLVVAIVAYFIDATMTGIMAGQNVDPMIGEAISKAISTALIVMMMVAAGLALIAVLVGLKLSHRVYGPMVPFTRHIEQLKAGNYAARMNLRRTDDLVELKDALNSLAEVLNKRHGTAHPRT